MINNFYTLKEILESESIIPGVGLGFLAVAGFLAFLCFGFWSIPLGVLRMFLFLLVSGLFLTYRRGDKDD